MDQKKRYQGQKLDLENLQNWAQNDHQRKKRYWVEKEINQTLAQLEDQKIPKLQWRMGQTDMNQELEQKEMYVRKERHAQQNEHAEKDKLCQRKDTNTYNLSDANYNQQRYIQYS